MKRAIQIMKVYIYDSFIFYNQKLKSLIEIIEFSKKTEILSIPLCLLWKLVIFVWDKALLMQ
jgi:hypothetical protein